MRNTTLFNPLHWADQCSTIYNHCIRNTHSYEQSVSFSPSRLYLRLLAAERPQRLTVVKGFPPNYTANHVDFIKKMQISDRGLPHSELHGHCSFVFLRPWSFLLVKSTCVLFSYFISPDPVRHSTYFYFYSRKTLDFIFESTFVKINFLRFN